MTREIESSGRSLVGCKRVILTKGARLRCQIVQSEFHDCGEVVLVVAWLRAIDRD